MEVTHPEMRRYFMLTSEACLLVMQAGARGRGGEVFVLDMGKPVKIVDLAREMIKLSGFAPDVDMPIVYTGIRAGEKLFEELLTEEEAARAAQGEKIIVAETTPPGGEFLERNLRELEAILPQSEDYAGIIAILKNLVPQFRQP